MTFKPSREREIRPPIVSLFSMVCVSTMISIMTETRPKAQSMKQKRRCNGCLAKSDPATYDSIHRTYSHRLIDLSLNHNVILGPNSDIVVDFWNGVGSAAIERVLNERIEKRIVQPRDVVPLSVLQNKKVGLHRVACARFCGTGVCNSVSELVFSARVICT
jgi:hypothetical protein